MLKLEMGIQVMFHFLLQIMEHQLKKGDPLTLEVHFSKEVLVDGFLVEKSYVTRAGVPKTKNYASANTILFTGKK